MPLCVLALAVSSFGCTAPLDGPGDEAAEQSEDALTGLRTGSYAIEREPSSGSYIKRLTISAGKKVELESVRVTTSSESWFWNPLLQVPTSKREALVLHGTYLTFAGDPGQTLISFDVTDRSIDHLIYSLETAPGSIELKAIGSPAFVLKSAARDATPTDTRVLHCTASRWNAVITLDENQRRRGTMKITRKAGAERTDPPNGSLEVAYTGGTGVEDYMAYEGEDRAGNAYEFALRRADLERTSGPISQVGLGFKPEYSSSYSHKTLACTIAPR